MKIIHQKSIKSLFERLLKKCESATLAVAWANPGEAEAKVLQSQSKKICKMYVGTSFWHTDPSFIEEYIDHPGCIFIKDNVVFHPKVYLFEHADGKWDGIIGSANFTRAAFASNQEVMVHWDEKDLGAQAARESLDQILESYKVLPRLTSSMLHRYRAYRENQRDKMSSLSGEYESDHSHSFSNKAAKKRPRSLLDSEIFSLDWNGYATRVARDTTLLERVEVIKASRRLFQEKKHLADFSLAERKGVAGFGPEKDIRWHWFGAMSGAGYFKQAINTSPIAISKALDEIPLQGDVTKNQYDAFVKKFTNAIQRSGIATATRLLAMKRPDVFLCMTNSNSVRMAIEFGIPKRVSLDNYWDRIVLRIRDAIWWSSSTPGLVREKEIWKARAAFLDSLFYEDV
jgi:HKD family nuclease